MPIYQWKTNTNGCPMVSEPHDGFIRANTPLEAINKVINRHNHPCGLFSAGIFDVSEENRLLVRYDSKRAATQSDAPCGTHHWDGDRLYVDDVLMVSKSARIEVFGKDGNVLEKIEIEEV